MTFDQLQQFVAAASAKNLTVAAESLYISHSAISRSITALEKEFNVKLLNRSSRSVTCTKAGDLLLLRGQRILDEIAALKDDLVAIGDSEQSILRFSCALPLGSEMMDFIQSFRQETPVKFQFKNNTPFQAIEDLTAGRCDCSVTYSYACPPHYPGLSSLTLESGRFVFVTSVRNPLATRSTIYFQELLELSAQYPIDRPLSASQSVVTRENAMLAEVNADDLFFSVKMNLNSIIVPEHIARESGDQCVCIPVEGHDVDTIYQVNLCYNDQNPNPALFQFIDRLKDSSLCLDSPPPRFLSGLSG
jgi:DNA-binding transcriptional LysR family regulator